MKKQAGFTLIEMVVVIVILGILAVTAAPRFLNLQGDARESSLEGLKGAMAGSTGIVYGKAAIDGVETDASDKTVSDGTTDGKITIAYGYPTASDAGIIAAVDMDTTNEWDVSEPTTVDNTPAIRVTLKGTTIADEDAKRCYVEYVESTGVGVTPTITVQADGC
ncbi:type II secretion system protein [Vibrio hippocampi]|uniref:MSHA biogenesis protein MshA n=1 Tax=Vibrio hippocampi TaxID=654686 RepID=A0ABM8ZJ57_9VIBR|nr:type II secretion system protein [Vibrio hippocampi]CAH0526869.1 hypothetical protein VHP8226_02245 [Vibrio hippocampi]